MAQRHPVGFKPYIYTSITEVSFYSLNYECKIKMTLKSHNTIKYL